MKSKVKAFIGLIGALLSVASILMLFLPAASSEELSVSGWNMIRISFTFKYGSLPEEKFTLSYDLSLIATILVFLLILGASFSLASFGLRFEKNKSAVKIFGILALICLIPSGILFFLLKETCTLPNTLPNLNELFPNLTDLLTDFVLPDIRKSAFSLGIGAILGGLAALISAVCSAIVLLLPAKD